jgi:hypothetical protein
MRRRAAAPELELRRAAISGDRNRRVFAFLKTAAAKSRFLNYGLQFHERWALLRADM